MEKNLIPNLPKVTYMFFNIEPSRKLSQKCHPKKMPARWVSPLAVTYGWPTAPKEHCLGVCGQFFSLNLPCEMTGVLHFYSERKKLHCIFNLDLTRFFIRLKAKENLRTTSKQDFVANLESDKISASSSRKKLSFPQKIIFPFNEQKELLRKSLRRWI